MSATVNLSHPKLKNEKKILRVTRELQKPSPCKTGGESNRASLIFERAIVQPANPSFTAARIDRIEHREIPPVRRI